VSGCCGPSRDPTPGGSHTAAAVPERTAAAAVVATVRIPAGEALLGNVDMHAYPGDGEGPVHAVRLDAFELAPHAVTNSEFGRFAEATGYRTEAERFGWSFVFAGLLPDDFPETRGVAQAPWWRQVEGATWDHPVGPQSSIDDARDHPVVHVSHADAGAYCAWAGGRLPTEAEWEYAARGGLEGAVYPWGSELEPGGEHRMNVWQGEFPRHNTLADGHYGTCPVGEFPANGYGLHNMTGNVWEWTADWFDVGFRARDRAHNPLGPLAGTHRVQKGGSYLCHASYCRRYRAAARQANSPDASTGNLGFRCVLAP
jgi:formylglycine-generating enzyme